MPRNALISKISVSLASLSLENFDFTCSMYMLVYFTKISMIDWSKYSSKHSSSDSAFLAASLGPAGCVKILQARVLVTG